MTTTDLINRATDGRPWLFVAWYAVAAVALYADTIAAALVRVWGAL